MGCRDSTAAKVPLRCEPICLALAYIGFIGPQNSRAEKPFPFPLWISDIVGAADLLLAMVLGSVLLLGRRSGGRSVLSTRRQRPTWAAAMTANVQAGQAPTTRSNLTKSIDLLTLWLILVDLAANAPRERRKGYSVRSDGGDEARCGRCCMTTVRR
jgi:hypothetical protein